ncbi:UDP-glucosyltransferase 2 isoform X2 [Anabrus simplex]|uniref:UDP-glucosyltransferase 2 isoform X2 n=1 Tax=Anabrus simplex TaxID=316456 RepID=UPI0035A37EE2
MAHPRCFWATVFFLVLAAGASNCARILALFPVPAKSHVISFSALTQELARRGHQVTVVSGFPVKPPMANYTDITVHTSFSEEDMPNMFKFREHNSTHSMLTMIWDMGLKWCERELKHPNVQKFIEDKESQFDLIILEVFLSECFYGFVHKYKAPLIHISSNTISVMMGDGVGNPHTSSYIPELVMGYNPKMSFLQRFSNFGVSFFGYLFREFYFLPKQQELVKKYFKDPSIPPIQEMEKNASLLLLNTHFSLGFPRPFTPNTIEVGGMHIKPGKKLPEDIQKYMDGAKHGVVYFSLGSNVKSKDMPIAMRQAFLNTFAKLKQKVLWKWEDDTLPGVPDNVRIGKWMPQNDILAHPNLRVFITHGGLLSTQEATYHGVPLLAIPVAGDQIVNAQNAQARGYAIMLELEKITTESLSWALNELFNNPRYRENVKQMSAIFRDQPQSPLEKAVYWTEYVLRHKGAPHMRSAALDLWWFQYYLLDVLAVLLGAVAVSLVITWVSCRALYRLLFSKAKGIPLKKHSKSKKIN